MNRLNRIIRTLERWLENPPKVIVSYQYIIETGEIIRTDVKEEDLINRFFKPELKNFIAIRDAIRRG